MRLFYGAFYSQKLAQSVRVLIVEGTKGRKNVFWGNNLNQMQLVDTNIGPPNIQFDEVGRVMKELKNLKAPGI